MVLFDPVGESGNIIIVNCVDQEVIKQARNMYIL